MDLWDTMVTRVRGGVNGDDKQVNSLAGFQKSDPNPSSSFRSKEMRTRDDLIGLN